MTERERKDDDQDRGDDRVWTWKMQQSKDAMLCNKEWDWITYLTIAKRLVQGLVIMLVAGLLIMTLVQPWREYTVITERHMLGNQTTDIHAPLWFGETLCYLNMAYDTERAEEVYEEWLQRYDQGDISTTTAEEDIKDLIETLQGSESP